MKNERNECLKTERNVLVTYLIFQVQHLTRVHHRNLVSLIGYCKDKKHLALVYEYMHGGNVQDRLRGMVPQEREKLLLGAQYFNILFNSLLGFYFSFVKHNSSLSKHMPKKILLMGVGYGFKPIQLKCVDFIYLLLLPSWRNLSFIMRIRIE